MPNTQNDNELHNQKQRDYYSGRTQEQNHRIAVRNSDYVKNHLDQVIARAALSYDESIIDIGCGMGKYTIPLAERGFNVTGMDLTPHLIETLAGETEGRVEIPVHIGDILDPAPELLGRFERVVGFFILHHLPDQNAAFKGIARMLKPGGSMAILEPNPFCPLYYVQISLSPTMSWEAEKGILDLTRPKLLAAAHNADLVGLKQHRFGILPPFLRNLRLGAPLERAFDWLVPLRGISAFQLITASRPD